MLENSHVLFDIFDHVFNSATDPWGVRVERVEVKDVSLPKSLQRAMAAEVRYA